jgi:isoleucyl-tRNA synthetase
VCHGYACRWRHHLAENQRSAVWRGQPGAYRDVTEPSVYVRFPVVGRDYDLLVWTTTPWTLPSNVAAAIGPAIDYVRVRAPEGGRDLVMARARVTEVLGADAEIVAEVTAASLVGARYEAPFSMLPLTDERAFTVVADDFVTIDDGSGIVHLAPAFGEEDKVVTDAADIDPVVPVGPDGRFTAPVVDYEGMLVFDANSILDTPAHFVVLDWDSDRISGIHDFLFATYAREALDWVRLR